MPHLPKKVILTSLIAALFVTAYIIFFLNIRSINANIASIQAEIKNEDDRELGLRKVGKSLSETEVERQKLFDLLVPKNGEVDFIMNIENIGRDSGVSVSIDSLSIEKTQFEGIEKIEARISAKGSLTAIRGFYGSMHRMNKAIDWKRVMIAKGQADETGGGQSSWSLVSEISVYKIK